MANDLTIRISAEDSASDVLKKIQASMAKISEPIDKMQGRFSRLGDFGASNLGKLEKGFRNAATAAEKVVEKVVAIVPGLAAIGGAGSLAGLSALAVRFGSFGFTLNKTSKLLGMNAQDLAAWHVAAKRAGVSAEEFDSSMSASQMAIRGAANGANPQAMLLLQKMGVQIARNKDGTVDYYSTQMRLMKAIQGQKSVEAQREVAGTFGYGGILPMIQQGTWDADKARAYRQGLVPTAAEIARAKAFNEDISDLSGSVEGLGNRIGGALIPVLDPVVKRMSEWLDKNRADIADKVATAVQKFVTWLAKIDWDEVASKAKALWDNIGGIKGVAIAVAAITFGGPIGAVANLISSLVTLTTATVPAALTALGTLGLAGVAAWGALKVAKLAGLPDVDEKQGIEDVKNGDWMAASTHLPAADFLRAYTSHMSGASNADIAAFLADGKNPAATADGATSSTPAAGSRVPLGIRTNNPANLHDRADKQRTFETPETGIREAAENLRRGYRGLTVAEIVDKWTGGARTGNTAQMTANYVGLLSQGTGLRADQVPDLNNKSVVSSLIAAQIRAENGQQPYSSDQINAGVAAAFAGNQGGSIAPAMQQDAMHSARMSELQSQAQTLKLDVTFHGTPAGVRPEAKTQDGSYLPTKVNYRLDGM
ncbi:hypothetical protein [Caballeronia sp. S22]|uniref:hypothetical protein n=1 Tax=Caballeronia sp. S22 TaxID=3137182 RepID=UPI003530CD9D